MNKRNILLIASICVMTFFGCASQDAEKNGKPSGNQIKKATKPSDDYIKNVSLELGKPLQWSKPVNGLVVRIETINYGYSGNVILVRLKNVSKKPFVVPTGNPTDKKKARFFELYLGDSTKIQLTAWVFPDRWGRMHNPGSSTGHFIDRPFVSLKPGQSAIAFLCGSYNEQLKKSTRMMVVFRNPSKLPNKKYTWTGTVATPVYPAQENWKHYDIIKRTIPFPDYFPTFSGFCYIGGNMELPFGDDWQFTGASNNELHRALDIYQPEGVAKEFTKRMNLEHDLEMKFVYAYIVASNGGDGIKDLIIKCRKETDHNIVEHTLGVLDSRARVKNPPEWVVDELIAALKDERPVTIEGKTITQRIRHSPISYYAKKHIETIGKSKSKKALPILKELLKKDKDNDNEEIMIAIDRIHGKEEIDILLESLKRTAKKAKWQDGSGLSPRRFYVHVTDMGYNKEKKAVPILLEYLEFTDVIVALRKIGDKRALEPLRKIVAAKGEVKKGGLVLYPELNARRLYEAELAVILMGEPDPVPKLQKFFLKPSPGGTWQLRRHEAFDVLFRLNPKNDPRLIPYCINLIKNDLDGHIVLDAVHLLSKYKYKKAVFGLLGAWDVDIAKKTSPGIKFSYKQQDFWNDIAESLRNATGEDIGTNKEAWNDWWRKKGIHRKDLK